MEITAVLRSSGYIAQLPEDTRTRIGKSFGGSYNKQFQIMLAFAGLNLVVTILLAFVRKRMGIFGTMPTRKEANEFTKDAEETTMDAGKTAQASSVVAAADLPSTSSQGTEYISEVIAKHDVELMQHPSK